MAHDAPFDLDLDRFLSAADDHRVDVDRIFAKNFARLLREMQDHDPDGLKRDPFDRGRPSLIEPSLTYHHVPAGVLLCDGDDPVGGYLSCDLSLDDAYQGRGLGAEIVIERCLADGFNPVWHLDEAAYSPAGIAAHRAAWRRVRSNPGEVGLRLARMETARA